MFDQQVRIEVERGGKRASVREGVSGNEVAGVVRAVKEPDVTLIISREDNDVLCVEEAATVADEWLKGDSQ